MNIADIDKNFKPALVGDHEVVYLDARKVPLSIEGFPFREGLEAPLNRLPLSLTKDDVNPGAIGLACCTSGGAIRFRSDSRYFAIRAKLLCGYDMNHMTRTGSCGFDIYSSSDDGMIFKGAAQVSPDQVDHDFECMVHVRDERDVGIRDWMLNLPLYGGVESIEIGFDKDAAVEPPTPHRRGRVAFYGSSITQGGCASRPGMAYSSLICRHIDAEQVNLGFSGCGLGEEAVARAIASIDNLAAFVLDYDYNAPSAEHLEETHERFFKIVRKAHPRIPIVIVTSPDIWPDLGKAYEEMSRRRAVIWRTYENATAVGDGNVYFVDGETLYGVEERRECAVDGCHPTDLGFYCMYRTIYPILSKALEK